MDVKPNLFKILKVLLPIFLVSASGYLIFLFFTSPSPQNVRVSNVTASSLTLSWTSKKPVKGCVVYTSQRNRILRNLLFFLPFTSHKICDTHPKATTHYLTLKNLSPETPYFYRINQGLKLFKKGLPNIATDKVSETQPLLPRPVYGKVTQGEMSQEFILIYLFHPRGGNLLSALTNKQGNYTQDAANFKDENGRFINLRPTDILEIEVEAGELGSKKITTPVSKSQPVEGIEL